MTTATDIEVSWSPDQMVEVTLSELMIFLKFVKL